MAKMNREEAVEFAKYIAMIEEVDFEKGEGKVVVFKNAVAIMEQAEDDPERVQMQFVMNDYADASDVEIEDNMSIEDMMRAILGE